MKFTIQNKTAEVFPASGADKPVIYLNTYADNGKELSEAFGEKNFNLVVISNLDWETDMSPWEIPSAQGNDARFKGGADAYLDVMLNGIVPEAEKSIAGTPPWRGLAGYSLAGLFALYAAYRTDIFSRFASVSGSLWFPVFREFVFENKLTAAPERIYFSLGNKEAKTRNALMKSVQQNTEEIEKFYRGSGIKTIFELNEGNHFADSVGRIVKGVSWVLEEEE